MGVIPALILPVDEKGEIDYKILEKQVSYLPSAGASGFFVNGTTGEGAHLSTEEKVDVCKVVKEVSQGRQFLCAACIQPCTRMVIEEIRALESQEPDFIVVVIPYYYAVPQEVIAQHYRENTRFNELFTKGCYH